METLRDYVNWGITHSDKTGSAEGVPLVMEKCKIDKRMKQLEVYGSDLGVGELITDNADVNYGKYKMPVVVKGKNLFDCINSKSLFNAYVSANSIQTTDSDISWKAQDGGTSTVHMDFGLLSSYVGKQLTLSFEIELDGESVSSTRFVICTETGQNRSALNGTVKKTDNRYYITSTITGRNDTDRLTLRLYLSNVKAFTTYTFKNVMVAESAVDVPFEPYAEPITTNVYLNEPLGIGDVLNFKDKKVSNGYGFKESVECELPTLTAQTSIVEIGTTVAPSNMKGKYIKR